MGLHGRPGVGPRVCGCRFCSQGIGNDFHVFRAVWGQLACTDATLQIPLPLHVSAQRQSSVSVLHHYWLAIAARDLRFRRLPAPYLTH